MPLVWTTHGWTAFQKDPSKIFLNEQVLVSRTIGEPAIDWRERVKMALYGQTKNFALAQQISDEILV